MDLFWEIFTLVTGVIYIVLEVRQKNFMWVVGVLTSAASIYVFMRGQLYAQVILNAYYLGVSFWGLWQWRKDSARLAAVPSAEDRPSVSPSGDVSASPSSGDVSASPAVHLSHLTWKTVLVSAVITVAGTFLLSWVLSLLAEAGLPEESMSLPDAAVTVLSAVATWWLARSYREQWYLWIVADLVLVVMCFIHGMVPMALLYIVYTAAAVYGCWYWKKAGVCVEDL